MPRDGEIGPTVRRKRATLGPDPIAAPPASTPIRSSDASGDDGANGATKPMRNAPHVATTVTELAALQKRRKFCIRQQSQADRSIESLIASTLGFRIDETEKERKAKFAQAKTHRLAVERGGEGQSGDDPHDGHALSAIAPLILASASNRKVWDDLRVAAEKQMRAMARALPVYGWAKSVKGFGDLGLAIICGEAGIPVGEYRTVEGLWKRMGLAVIDGERQRKKTDKVQAAAHGYSPKRRAEIWTLADSMFRHQWKGADEDAGTVAGPAGPYGVVYGDRRSVTLSRIASTSDLASNDPAKWTPARCNNDARRVMSKALLRDLWVEWRRATLN